MLVTVLESNDPGLLALAKSLLENGGIRSVTRGEGLQQLAVGVIFVQLQVAPDDAQQARALLSDLTAATRTKP